MQPNPATPDASEIRALLGPDTQYEGKLTFSGCVRIDGEFRGTILSDDTLVIGDQAKVHADIDIGTLIVLGGALHGQVRAAELVELHAPARLYGDVHTPQVYLAQGVVVEGQFTMPDCRIDPLEP